MQTDASPIVESYRSRSSFPIPFCKFIHFPRHSLIATTTISACHSCRNVTTRFPGAEMGFLGLEHVE